jgi:hypothetical protein
MKVSRVVAFVLLFTIIGTTLAFGDSLLGKIRVFVNGKESPEGVLIDGKSYLPLRELSESLHAMIDWDDSAKQAIIYKPNVHIFLFREKQPFGAVNKGKLTFNVFSQIDNLQTNIHSVKVTIEDPLGKSTTIQEQEVKNLKEKDNFWFVTEDIKYDFKTTGKYTVKFFMKRDKAGSYELVAEKVITAKD